MAAAAARSARGWAVVVVAVAVATVDSVAAEEVAQGLEEGVGRGLVVAQAWAYLGSALPLIHTRNWNRCGTMVLLSRPL
jgi:hypothetical protein